jgi:hypothetical protein
MLLAKPQLAATGSTSARTIIHGPLWHWEVEAESAGVAAAMAAAQHWSHRKQRHLPPSTLRQPPLLVLRILLPLHMQRHCRMMLGYRCHSFHPSRTDCCREAD